MAITSVGLVHAWTGRPSDTRFLDGWVVATRLRARCHRHAVYRAACQECARSLVLLDRLHGLLDLVIRDVAHVFRDLKARKAA
jgi:hypothetical protein